MIKVGRYTSALLLVMVGLMLFIDQTRGTNLLHYLAIWWPLLLISLGIEYFLLNGHQQKTGKQMKLAVGSLIFAIIISMLTFGITQLSAYLPNSIWQNIRSAVPFLSYNAQTFEGAVQKFSIPADTEKITFENTNGGIVLQSGAVDQIEIAPTTEVDIKNQDDAKKIADASTIKMSKEGNNLIFTAQGKSYTISQFTRATKMNLVARMDLVVTLPESLFVSIDAHTQNGSITADHVKINNFTAQSMNGSITISGASGTVDVKTLNGSLYLKNNLGDIKAETTNGSITVIEAAKNLQASTINGAVHVDSDTVQGEWNTSATTGSINIRLPVVGDYTVEGKGMHASTDIPGLDASGRSISGTIGEGSHHISAHSVIGSISFNKVQ